jgi:hypothetical protein
MEADANRHIRRGLDVRGAERGAARSLYRTLVPPQRKAKWLVDSAILHWAFNYLKVAFAPRHRFPRYDAPPADKPGIFPLPHTCSVALVGDWGSGTASAYRVMDQIREQQPDITIHLGDIYYSGTKEEVERYFLHPAAWHRGPYGSYALNANHEMYSGGEGYFDMILPAFNQQTSYFCLENDHWRIVGLDTGYYAKIFPFFELVFAPKFLKVHKAIRQWLADVVFADETDRRPVVLLTHHQWFSAFESEYARFGKQLRPYLDRVVLWYWGHEHRFAGYGLHGRGKAPKIRARCIGHGGMPVELERPKRGRDLVFHDERSNQANTIKGEDIGFCGHALLTCDGDELVARYYDENGTTLLVERWTHDTATQQLKGDVLSHHGGLTIMPGKTLDDLVQ